MILLTSGFCFVMSCWVRELWAATFRVCLTNPLPIPVFLWGSKSLKDVQGLEQVHTLCFLVEHSVQNDYVERSWKVSFSMTPENGSNFLLRAMTMHHLFCCKGGIYLAFLGLSAELLHLSKSLTSSGNSFWTTTRVTGLHFRVCHVSDCSQSTKQCIEGH